MWRGMSIVGGAGLAGVGALARSLHRSHRRGRVPKNVQYNYVQPPSREEMVERMKSSKEIFDVVVVGGGATGSGVALDAATRGLKCALLERNDFGCGTSSRSTKLLHGGIRYLQQAMTELDLGKLHMVREALVERSHLLAAAPYMTRPVAILMPVYRFIDVPMFWFGVKLYDWLGKLFCWFQPGLPNCFWISRSNSTFFFPLLRPKKLKGSVVYYDGQSNDARLNVQLALTAACDGYIEGMKGAVVANYCKVYGVDKKSVDDKTRTVDAVYDVQVEDTLNGTTFTIQSRSIVNCTGPFCDKFRQISDPKCRDRISLSAGSHITLPEHYSSSPFGMIIPETKDGRVLFYLPWEGSTIVGTTERPVDTTENPQATQSDVDFIMKESCRYLTLDEADLRKDIKSTWCGIRSLVMNPKMEAKGGTQALTRSHEIVVEENGIVSIMGGKWTTYRQMAEDGVDKIVEIYGSKFPTKPTLPKTKFLLLSNGIDDTKQFTTQDVVIGRGRLPVYLHHTYGLSIAQAQHLVQNYGFRALEICKMDKTLLKPLIGASDYPFIRAEIIYAIRHEMARTPSDVLARRTRIAFLDAAKAQVALKHICSLMKRELSWSTDTTGQMYKEGVNYLKTMQGGL